MSITYDQTVAMENGNSSKRVKLSNGSIFGDLPMYPPDPIFNVKDSYLADKDPKKVNLGIGGISFLGIQDVYTLVKNGCIVVPVS